MPFKPEDFQTIAAGSGDVKLGPNGAQGDILARLVIVPVNLAPGAVTIKDSSGGGAIIILPGGAASLTELKPITVELLARSKAGAWHVNCGADVTAIAVGRFT